MAELQKITPCLWFDREAEAAVNFYVSLFPGSRITSLSRYGKNMPLPEGTVLMAEFELAGRSFQALNGGPVYKLNEAISLSTACDDQAEVDRLWHALTADGGAPGRCCWLKDRFGLSWQIVPRRFTELMRSGKGEQCGRMMGALMGMSKPDVAQLEAAFEGR